MSGSGCSTSSASASRRVRWTPARPPRLGAGPGRRSEAYAVGVPEPSRPPLAAFVNGVLAHSLDYDDTHLPSVLHPSACVVPAALARGAGHRRRRARVIAAIAVGLEICVRLGMAGYDRDPQLAYFDRGQHATSICGAVAAAVRPACCSGSTPTARPSDRRRRSMACGVIEANRTGGTVKRMHCGWAAHAAVCAARLTARGFTGPPTVLEGRFGFFQAFLRGDFDAAAITDGLGHAGRCRGSSSSPIRPTTSPTPASTPPSSCAPPGSAPGRGIRGPRGGAPGVADDRRADRGQARAADRLQGAVQRPLRRGSGAVRRRRARRRPRRLHRRAGPRSGAAGADGQGQRGRRRAVHRHLPQSVPGRAHGADQGRPRPARPRS